MTVRSLFVTGTDTDVGKTVVTAALACHPEVRRAIKPVVSGAIGPSDPERIAAACGHPPLVFQRWTTPVSPHRAARLENAPLDVPGLLEWLAALPGPRLVEGAGGFLVPLADGFGIPDLARAAGHPVLIVAANRLGVLNHTALTVQAVRAAGLEVAGVVANALGDDLSCATNLADLRELLDVPVVPFPFLDPDDPAALADAGHHVWDALDRR